LDTGSAPVRVWDLPVRIVHWSFVLLIPALWWTGEEGYLDQHKVIGYAMLGLVAFRILWGFAGTSTARFASFVTGPARLFAYLNSPRGEPVIGHNPLGAWSVVALLLVLGGQVTAGLFAQDVDGLESGPLSYLVSYESADAARGVHHLLFNVLLGLIALHIAAILFYLIAKRDNLVGPMVTGSKRFHRAVAAPMFVPVWRFAVCAALAAALALWVSRGAPLP
jgi:cytochrome b